MIKNIIFDMGHVLIYFDRERYLNRHAKDCTPEERTLLLREIYLSADWIMQDRGTRTPAQTVKTVCERLPEHLHRAAEGLVCRWYEDITPVPGMADLVGELKAKGYGIYLLSNASCRQPDYWQRVPAARFFDGTLISYSVKLVKPMPEIYEKFFEKFSLKREECFFIDDSPANIEASLYVGMPGAVFHNDIHRLRRELRAAGVDVEA